MAQSDSITTAIKLTGGGQRDALDQVFFVRYSRSDRVRALTRDYLLGHHHDAREAEELASYYRNIAMALVLSHVCWFRDTRCEVISESALPTTQPHYSGDDYAIWGEPST